MPPWKIALRGAVKAVAGIAGLAFFLANPFSANATHIVAFFVSLPVLLVALLVWLIFDLSDH